MISAQILSLLAIAGNPNVSANARSAARSEITALARAESQKDPLDEAKRALTAIVENKDATEDQRKAARKALALLEGKPDPDDDKKLPAGRAATATEIAAAVALALRPPPAPPNMAKLRAQHVARGAAIVESRLTPAQRELLARSAPRAESKTATIEGTALVMPRRILTRAEALARMAELEAEAGQ